MNKNIDLFYKTREKIKSNLIDELLKDAKPLLNESEYNDLFSKAHAIRIIDALYDMVLIHSIYESNSIVSNFDWYDAFKTLIDDNLTQAVIDFYDAMPKLLSDSFTLNNNFYFVDLRCFIVDMEDSLRQDRGL